MHQGGQRPSGKEASFAPFVRNTTRLSGQIQLTIFEKLCMRSRSLMVVHHQTIWQLGLFCSIWSFFHFKIQSFESFFQCCYLRNKWIGAGGSLYIVVPTNHGTAPRTYNIVVNISQTSLPTQPHFAHDMAAHTVRDGWCASQMQFKSAPILFGCEIFWGKCPETPSEKPNWTQLHIAHDTAQGWMKTSQMRFKSCFHQVAIFSWVQLDLCPSEKPN